MERRELDQLFAFDRWANREAIGAVRRLDDGAPSELSDLLWHVLTATDNWLSRIEGTEPFEALGWDVSHRVDAVEAYAGRIEAKVAEFLDGLSDERLAGEFEYRNSSGAPFSNRVGDVLQHVVLHGVEHRAQVMYEVGKLGGEPVELEYAWFLRDPPADA
jgi:uncharacterized damage-inducible protein DinB